MRKYFGFECLVVSAVLTACSTPGIKKTDPSQQVKIDPSTEISEAPVGAPKVESIDQAALQKYLGLEFPKEQLGYSEKKFNTCDVGFGFSKVNNCRELYFTVIHFQMLCRDSEGTVSEAIQSKDLIHNADKNLRWDIKEHRGIASTDGSGYSQIRFLAAKSQRQQRFKLILQNDFLYLRAGEVNKIITPKPWCSL